MTVNLTISTRLLDSVVIVAPMGEIDLASSPRLRKGLEEAFTTDLSRFVIDLRGVGFIDSTGIGELVGCLRRCRDADLPLALVVPEGSITKILHVTGMDSVFDTFPDEESAVAGAVADD